MLHEKAEGGLSYFYNKFVDTMTDSVHAAALPGVVFAEYMKNKSGIHTVKRQKEAYKSLKRPVVY